MPIKSFWSWNRSSHLRPEWNTLVSMMRFSWVWSSRWSGNYSPLLIFAYMGLSDSTVRIVFASSHKLSFCEKCARRKWVEGKRYLCIIHHWYARMVRWRLLTLPLQRKTLIIHPSTVLTENSILAFEICWWGSECYCIRDKYQSKKGVSKLQIIARAFGQWVGGNYHWYPCNFIHDCKDLLGMEKSSRENTIDTANRVQKAPVNTKGFLK